MWSKSYIRIDLFKMKTVEECEKLLTDNEISEESITPSKLFSYKETIDTFFYDTSNFFVLAIIPKGTKEIQFISEFVEYLNKLKPITSKKTTLDLDQILDKISTSGLGSLNSTEIRFLKRFSK
jgi:hypothetical protein